MRWTSSLPDIEDVGEMGAQRDANTVWATPAAFPGSGLCRALAAGCMLWHSLAIFYLPTAWACRLGVGVAAGVGDVIHVREQACKGDASGQTACGRRERSKKNEGVNGKRRRWATDHRAAVRAYLAVFC